MDEEKIREGIKDELESQGYETQSVEIDKYVDPVIDEWLRNNHMTPIGEYESLSSKMRDKIAKIIDSIKDKKEAEVVAALGLAENESLDEVEGKEELDPDKKEQVLKDKEDDEDQKDLSKDEDSKKDKDESEGEEKKSKKEISQEEQIKDEKDKKDEYLSRVRKLHEMKLRELKAESKGDLQIDKHFVLMLYIQKQIYKEREAFIKEYGAEELTTLENEFAKEELKYRNKNINEMEKDLDKLNQLNERLDNLLDKMETRQRSLEKDELSLEEYSEDIEFLEKEKLEVLYEINKVNPELIEKAQERLRERGDLRKRVESQNNKKNLNKTTRESEAAANLKEEKMKDSGKKQKEVLEERLQETIDYKERRLEELRKELKGVDITTAEGKNRAFGLINEINVLEVQQTAMEDQKEKLDIENPWQRASYSGLEEHVDKIEEATEVSKEATKVKGEDISSDFLNDLKKDALKEPESAAEAKEYIDNIEKASEKAESDKDEKDKDEKSSDEETEEPTLLSRNRRPWQS